MPPAGLAENNNDDDGLLKFTPPDIYGQAHPIETPELLQMKLHKLEEKINNIPNNERLSYNEAQLQCPNLLNDAFKLQFLRCEQFRVDDATTRLMLYWEKRVQLFGTEKAFLPLTIVDGAYRGDSDEVALNNSFFRYIAGAKDPMGRSIIVVSSAQHHCPDNTTIAGKCKKTDDHTANNKSVARACWYAMHAALEENEEAQKKGVIMISDGRGLKLSNVDYRLYRTLADCFRGCFPVRISATHLVNNPSIANVILPVVKVLMGERLRKRVKIHRSSSSPVTKLEKYGLSKASLPQDLGGAISFDQKCWLQKRMAAGL